MFSYGQKCCCLKWEAKVFFYYIIFQRHPSATRAWTSSSQSFNAAPSLPLLQCSSRSGILWVLERYLTGWLVHRDHEFYCHSSILEVNFRISRCLHCFIFRCISQKRKPIIPNASSAQTNKNFFCFEFEGDEDGAGVCILVSAQKGLRKTFECGEAS